MKKIIYFLMFILLVSFNSASNEYYLNSYWAMDTIDLSGNTLIDVYNTKNGTINGVTTGGAGIVNEDLSFDGVNDKVTFTNSSIYRSTGDFSVGCWINPNENSDGHFFNSDLQGGTFGWGLILQTPAGASTIDFRVNTDGNDVASSSITYSNGKWYHVVGIHNNTENKIHLYINGTLSNSADVGTPQYTGTHPLGLGYRVSLNDQFYKGELDECFYANYSMSRDTIFEIFEKQKLGYRLDEDLIFYYNISKPLNNSILNSNIFNGSIILKTNETFGICSINNTIWNISDSNNDTFIFSNSSALQNKNYILKISCSGFEKILNFTFDTIKPMIYNIAPSNNSVLTGINFFQAEFYDLNGIWQYNITIKNESENIILNNFTTNISLLFTIQNIDFKKYIDLSLYPNGTYNYIIEVWDSHTDNNIIDLLDNYEFIKEKENIINEKYDNIEITYNYNPEVSVSNDIKKDKISYILNSSKIENYYYIESNKNINYLKDSKYKCHFIIDNKIWHDCEGLNNQKVTKINDKKYLISFDIENNKAVMDSTGFLNYNSESYIFNIGGISTTTTTTTEESISMFHEIIIILIIYIIMLIIYLLSKNGIIGFISAFVGLMLSLLLFQELTKHYLPLALMIFNAYIMFISIFNKD